MSVSSYNSAHKNHGMHTDDFLSGIRCLKAGLLAEAGSHFQLAYESVNNADVFHNKYASFCGLLRVLHGDPGGMVLCRDAASSEHQDGDVFLNLARVELFYDARKKAVEVIMHGLEVDAKHIGLRQMQRDLGIREHKALPWLNRDNLLNVMIGRCLRKKYSYWQGDYPFSL